MYQEHEVELKDIKLPPIIPSSLEGESLVKGSFRVKDLPACERPRERLLMQGSHELSTMELLSVLIGSGSEQHSALELSFAILQKLSECGRNPLHALREISAKELMQVYGIGEAKSATILAALELGRRVYLNNPQYDHPVVDEPKLASEILAQDLMYQRVEKFAVLFLDIKNRMFGKKVVSSGTATETYADPKEVFRDAIKQGALRIIVAHNHPSGDTLPSPEDLTLTEQLLQAGRVLHIPVLDHIILGNGNFRSIRQTTSLWQEHSQGD